jgi:hypothetical protein
MFLSWTLPELLIWGCLWVMNWKNERPFLWKDWGKLRSWVTLSQTRKLIIRTVSKRRISFTAKKRLNISNIFAPFCYKSACSVLEEVFPSKGQWIMGWRTAWEHLFEMARGNYKNHRVGIFSIRKAVVIPTLSESIVHDISQPH